MGYRLGVDLGTTFTAAAVDDGTGPTMVGLGNRALQVPSVLYLKDDGTFLCGEAAERREATEPDRVVREFKRRIGDTVPILVAGQPFSPQALTAKLLSWVIDTASERQGSRPDEVVLAYPANWGGYKRELFAQVALLADLPRSLTCTEPEAAATQYAMRAQLATGDKVAVYDLGGGTFDVCVLEKRDDGFVILGSPDGVEHLGGIDFDEAVFRHVLTQLDDVAAMDPDDPLVTAGLARLRRDCVEAKEALSNDVEAVVPVALPGVSTSVRLTRSELESLITPALRDTLAAMQRTLRSAGVTPVDLAAVVLVGGSSRIPLVNHLLQSELGVRTAMDTHPKHDIALGAVQFARRHDGAVPLPSAEVPRWPTRATDTAPLPTVAGAPAGRRAIAVKDRDAASARPGTPSGPPPATPGTPDTAGAPGPPRPRPGEPGPPSWLGRKPLIVAGAALGALVLVGAGVWLAVRGDGTASQSTPSGGSSAAASTDASGAGEPLVSEKEVLVAVDTGGDAGLDLVAVATDGTERSVLPEGWSAGDQDLPSISPDRRTLQFRVSPEVGAEDWTSYVYRKGEEPKTLFASPPPAGVTCPGRLVWDPTDPTRGALNCAMTDSSGTVTRVVFWATIDADGRVDGASLDHEPAFPADPSMSSIGYTASGGLVASYNGADPGLRYLPPGATETVKLTSGPDFGSTAAPEGDLVAFNRAGVLYLVSSASKTLGDECKGTLGAPEGDGYEVCRLGGGDGVWYDDPAWSWDGHTLVFRKAAGPEEPGTLMAMDVRDPGSAGAFADGFDATIGPPSWARR